MNKLKTSFSQLIQTYSENKEYNEKCWDQIERQYSSTSRHYHNLSHLQHMFSELEEVKTDVDDLDTLMFSIFYHDIVYKSTAKDNEHQSALVCEEHLSKTSFARIDTCKTQIEATKIHQTSVESDTNILLDLDLAILGGTTETYEKYRNAIRKEYKIFPNFMYRKGRMKVLKHFLELPAIYKTDFFRDNFEERAKNNIRKELEDI